jgi:NHL repeat
VGTTHTSQILRRLAAVALATAAVLAIATPVSASPGDVSTFAGSGTFGFVNGNATAAQFSYPVGVAIDTSGTLYVADIFNDVVRRVTTGGVVSTFAGSGISGWADGPAATAQFNSPSGVAVDAAGNVFVADLNNHRIRKITSSGVVSTLAGTGNQGFVNGPGAVAEFDNPYGLAVDASGNVYVAETANHAIRKITPAGVVSTLAGSGTSGSADGIGPAASFYGPSSVAVTSTGDVFVADRMNHLIRKVTPSGVVTTFAGTGLPGSADGLGSVASFWAPTGVGVDAAGNVVVADENGNKIRAITPSGVVSTVAGTGSAGSADGPSTAASFFAPYGVAVDPAGNIFVGDAFNSKVRRIEAPVAGVSMVQPLPLLATGFALCVAGVIIRTRRRRSRSTCAYHSKELFS